MALTDQELLQIKQSLAAPEAATNWLSQHWMSLTLMVALSVFAFWTFQMGAEDVAKIWNKLFGVSLYWLCATVFELFYNGTRFNVNEKISADSRSLGTYIAAVLIGTAVVIALS